MKNRIPQLPRWCLTGTRPAFYDTESSTAIEQTAKLYGAIQQLIDDYNNFADEVNTTINTFVNDSNADQEEFENHITKIVHDYIIMLDTKLELQDKEIQESIVYIKDNLTQGIKDVLNELIDSGEIDEIITNVFDDLGIRVTTLETNTSNLETRATDLETKDNEIDLKIANLYFDTLQLMKSSTSLNEDDIVKTLGYYSLNDGGSALYKIRTKTESDIGDNGSIIFIGENLVAELIIENNTINVKQFGVKGDNVTDDYENIQKAIYYSSDYNKKLFIPNGTYLISNTLKFVTSEIDGRYNQLFNIEGESSSVIINKFNGSDITDLFDYEFVNHLRLKNITSENLQLNIVPNEIYNQGFDVWSDYLKNKDFIFKNVIYNGNGGSESYYNLICTPAPEDNERYTDGKYARYPLRINSNSGYNAIEIENFNFNENDDTATATDNSAIGIIDRVTNSTGVIFIDMNGDRSFERYVRGKSNVQSSLKPGTVYEVSKDGHIAIGCSTDYNDDVAKSTSAIKIRDNSPEIMFFDSSNQNKSICIRSYKPDGMTNALTFILDGTGAFNLINKWRNNQPITGATNLRVVVSDVNNNGLRFYLINSDDSTLDKDYKFGIDSKGRLRYGTEDSAVERQRLQLINGAETYFRPTLSSHWRDVGYMMFDTDLGKPIWWNGSNWVDATGSTV